MPLGVAARYSRVQAASSNTSLIDSEELGGGPSWRVANHEVKLQGDCFRHWSERIGDGWNAVRVQLTAGF